MSPTTTSKRAVVVGAGPVGCLAALALAKRGWSVDLYEGRPDIRLASSKAAIQKRSINLAISHRGIAALEAIEPAAAKQFLQSAIPMRGRMIHKVSGELDSQLYDRDGQCINSIDRSLLNEGLLEQADASPNIRAFFNHRVIAADFDKKEIIIRDTTTNQEYSTNFDLCIGADGSYSVVRRQMMRVVRMNYQQEYIRDEYLELKMPAGRDQNGEPTFALDPNHLHIWPRHSFMLIALPNQDKTFTCTLFAPSADLDRLSTADSILSWFQLYFPDAIRAIGEKELVENFMRNPRSPLICIKANQYHYKDRAIILGDAAHSMVPFYGQGLNAGLEDVRVLTTLLDEEGVTSTPLVSDDQNNQDRHVFNALKRYTDSRHKDLIAISDLAMNNYVEMRHSVTLLSYWFRKMLDNFLYSASSPRVVSLPALLQTLSVHPYPLDKPKGWLPLYTMVTFRPDISYAIVQERAARQAAILTGISWIGVSLLGAAGTWLTRKMVLYYLRQQ
ncbi:FAD/NAD(P)-binding domain-containing protein [Pholiota conissans]|uniref:Kynurenine 3-monooxygenase n=1 Tax=Pholiota conissans TaxID=109636 RepID=A0A9P6CYB5_9AGAR|nr:FAD/NAD(P)-binding domain-containing protein [Pholiota conissans]